MSTMMSEEELETHRRAGLPLTELEQHRLAAWKQRVQNARDEAERYNGYANRETWAFNLHWQNDQGLYNEVLEFGRSFDLAESDDSYLGHEVIDRIVRMVEDLPDNPTVRMMAREVGSFWRVDEAEVGAAVRESLGAEGVGD